MKWDGGVVESSVISQQVHAMIPVGYHTTCRITIASVSLTSFKLSAGWQPRQLAIVFRESNAEDARCKHVQREFIS